MEKPIVSLKNINKSFYGVPVLKDIMIDIYPGEVVAILGQNGAGKSVTMKILAGVIPAGEYEGDIISEGSKVSFSNVNDAEKEGIYMIPQEIEVFQNLTVAENLFFNQIGKMRIIQWDQIFKQAEDAMEMFHLDIDPRAKMGTLTRAQQQLLLITKALIQSQENSKAKVLILDEPTASLTFGEAEVLFAHIERIKKLGIACLFISHRLNEVFRISDRICVIRDGRVEGNYLPSQITADEVISAMIGRSVQLLNYEKNDRSFKCVLNVENWSVYHPLFRDRMLIDHMCFRLYEGEILGVYGLVGSGKSELALSIFGAWEGETSGKIYVNGTQAEIHNTKDAIKCGIGFLPEDRRQALMNVRNLRENISFMFLDRLRGKNGFLDLMKEEKDVQELSDILKVKASSLEAYPASLSGGNKQKLLVARLLGAQTHILIIDEPTVGVDINARQDLYDTLRRLAREEHYAVLMFSSDVEEIMQISDEIMVMQNGTKKEFFDSAAIQSGEVTEEVILKSATVG